MSQQASTVLDPVRAAPAVLRRIPTRWAVAGGVTVLAFLPLLITHGRQLWLRPHYQFFPLALAGAAVLAWPILKDGPRSRPGPKARTVSFVLLGLSWLMLATAFVLDSPWLASVACLVLLSAAPLGVGGWPFLRSLVPAIGYLLLVIPPPLGLDLRLVGALQTSTARASSRILDYFSVYHLMEGNVVVTAENRYFVEEACSGIHSLFSIVACTLFYILWARVHWLRALCLLAAGVFWVVVQNISRVVLIAYVGWRWHWDLSKDWPHYALDFVLFAFSLALLASTDRLLRFLGKSFSWREETLESQSKLAGVASHAALGPRVAPTLWLPAGALAGAFAVLAVPQLADLALGVSTLIQSGYSGSPLIEQYNQFQANTLPDEIAGWSRVKVSKTTPVKDFEFEKRDSGNTLGEYSRAWRYQKNGQFAIISFDFPFPIWHDLRGCYVSSGWNKETDEFYKTPLPGHDVPFDCCRVTYSKAIIEHGYLWFTEFDQAGNPVAPALTRDDLRWKPRLENLANSWKRLLGFGGAEAPRNSAILQVQVFTQRYDPLTPEQQKDMEKFFTQGAELIRARCVALLGAH